MWQVRYHPRHRRPRGDKRRTLAIHAKRRAATRYELNLTDADLREIVDSIQSGRARYLWRQSLRVSAFAVEFQGKTLPVVFDRRRKCVCTVLPEEALELAGHRGEGRLPC